MLPRPAQASLTRHDERRDEKMALLSSRSEEYLAGALAMTVIAPVLAPAVWALRADARLRRGYSGAH